MVRVAARSHLTAAEYLVWEHEQAAKHEYIDGEVYAMSGGSFRHNALSAAIGEALRSAHRGLGCTILSSDQRVGVESGKRYVYPDVTVVCGALESEAGTNDVLANPTIIVEVLSQSTEQYDRGLKWTSSQLRPSLTDYVLVSQAEPRVEHFRRGTEGWIYRTHGPGTRITFTNGAAMEVDMIYAGVMDLPGE